MSYLYSILICFVCCSLYSFLLLFMQYNLDVSQSQFNICCFLNVLFVFFLNTGSPIYSPVGHSSTLTFISFMDLQIVCDYCLYNMICLALQEEDLKRKAEERRERRRESNRRAARKCRDRKKSEAEQEKMVGDRFRFLYSHERFKGSCLKHYCLNAIKKTLIHKSKHKTHKFNLVKTYELISSIA